MKGAPAAGAKHRSTMSVRVLICDDFPEAAQAALRRAGCEVAYLPGMARSRLLAEAATADALIVRVSTAVDRALLGVAPRLRVVAMPGTGLDHIDQQACAERGIRVISAPGANTESVAELALGLMIEVARHLPEAEAHVRSGGWDKRRFMGGELAGAMLGLVGRGRIGTRVAELATAFRMRVLACDPAIPGSMALHDLLPAADYVSVHVPLLPATRHLIGAAELALMKPGAVLLNLSRGGIVDEGALPARPEIVYVADVMEDEPGPDGQAEPRPWLRTPHIGAWTREAQDRAALEIAEQIRAMVGELAHGHTG